jgi:hypothetical protein
MRSLGGKWRKLNAKARTTAKTKANIGSLRPSGFAPAFGRAEAPFGAGFAAGLKPGPSGDGFYDRV